MRSVGEYMASELRQPNPEAAALFKKLAAESKDIEEEKKQPEGKTVKFNCMDCGILTEFPDTDTALDGDCKKCGKPIFRVKDKK